jgi:DNA mismatch repair protein MLH3
VGERFCTSKCFGLRGLEEDVRTYGFRGEALASLREVGALDIITRCPGACNRSSSSTTTTSSSSNSSSAGEVTMTKRMDHTGTTYLGPAITARLSHGTTVRVTGVFARWPVRRKALRGNVEIDAIIQRVQTFALINNGVAFSVVDATTGARLLDTRPAPSVATVFGQLYGDAKARSLAPLGTLSAPSSPSNPAAAALPSAPAISIRGYLGLEGHHSRALQFLYINGRCVTKTPVHKLLQQMLSRTSVCRPGKDADSDRIGREPVRHAVFVVNVLCSPSEYVVPISRSVCCECAVQPI